MCAGANGAGKIAIYHCNGKISIHLKLYSLKMSMFSNLFQPLFHLGGYMTNIIGHVT